MSHDNGPDVPQVRSVLPTTLVKAKPRTLDRLRGAWMAYQGIPLGWRIILPTGLFGVAALLSDGAWQGLGQGEYLGALLLTLAGLFIGVGAALAITKRIVKYIAVTLVVLFAMYSGAVILIAKDDKPWSILLTKREQVVKIAPQPTASPVEVRPAPIISPSLAPSPSLSPSRSPLATASPTISVAPTPSVSPIATATPTPEPRPSPVSGPSIGPNFGRFMNELTLLHKGYKTYHILSPAGIGMCDYYVRLGMMEYTTRVYLALYVRQSYCTKQIFDNVANNYQTIVEDLKVAVKNDELHILELKVEPTVYVYSDDRVGPLKAAAGTRNGISFYFFQYPPNTP